MDDRVALNAPVLPLTAASRFAGVYRLVSVTSRPSNGKPAMPEQHDLTGQTWYDGRARMWVLLTPATGHSRARSLATTVAYFGTYEVDERTQTVVHTVEGSLHPEWIGRRLMRRYVFEGNELHLSFDRDSSVVDTIYERIDGRVSQE